MPSDSVILTLFLLSLSHTAAKEAIKVGKLYFYFAFEKLRFYGELIETNAMCHLQFLQNLRIR